MWTELCNLIDMLWKVLNDWQWQTVVVSLLSLIIQQERHKHGCECQYVTFRMKTRQLAIGEMKPGDRWVSYGELRLPAQQLMGGRGEWGEGAPSSSSENADLNITLATSPIWGLLAQFYPCYCQYEWPMKLARNYTSWKVRKCRPQHARSFLACLQ